MTTAEDIAKLIPTTMSAGLVAHNLNAIKKKKKKNLLGMGVDNIVGLSMIQETAGFTDW